MDIPQPMYVKTDRGTLGGRVPETSIRMAKLVK